MSIQTQHLQSTARDGQSDFTLKNGDSHDVSQSLPPNNGKESYPCAVGQCDVNMSRWNQSGPRDQRLIDLGNSKRKISESKPPVMVERRCVFCKDRGSSYIRPDVTIFVLTIMVVILTVAMTHAHMKLSRMEEKLARMEDERSENKEKMQMFTEDFIAVEDPAESIPAPSFPDETSDGDVTELGGVGPGSDRRVRRNAGQKDKQKKTPGNGKKKNNKCGNNKQLIDQYCFDKIEGSLYPMSLKGRLATIMIIKTKS
ncbi:unnamed protein product [Lymnaea stagnalis]|uniref:Uncharacterized protein n=1 Tax=Lymnaea stagnalis TaxID=6523 RepID=A0AAV2HBT8_LYMST